MTEMAKKFDKDKTVFGLIPPLAEQDVADVFTFGSKKYGKWNYLKGHESLALYSAVRRHLHSYFIGDFIDSESGLPHLAHAAATILMLLEQHHIQSVMDNRPYTETKGEMRVDKQSIVR